MAAPQDTLYDVLGLSRDASAGDIARAYRRLVKEFEKDTTPPDPRREARIREAFETLSDEARRAEYDGTLAAAEKAPATSRAKAVALGAAALAVLGVAGWILAGRQGPTEIQGAPAPLFQAEVSRSVGRVQAIGMDGKVVDTGVAFTIAEGVMATTCEGLVPGAQIVVHVGARPAPARIATVDEALGLCKLAMDGGGSWPLATGGPALRIGDRVFAAGPGPTGEFQFVEGSVKRLAEEGGRTLVEASVPIVPALGGRPLLDSAGRVVAAALPGQSGNVARHVVIHPSWAERPAPPPSAPAASPEATEGAAKEPSAPTPPADPIQRRAQEIAPKIAPPPSVPGDI
jgi:hypothetical protein